MDFWYYDFKDFLEKNRNNELRNAQNFYKTWQRIFYKFFYVQLYYLLIKRKVKLSEKEQIRNKRPPFLKGAGN